MKKYNSNVFKLNDKLINTLIEKKGESYIPKKAFRVLYPSRFMNIKLAEITSEVLVIGILLLIDDKDNYCRINLPVRYNIIPSSIDTVLMDNIEYMELTLLPTDVFMSRSTVVKNADFIFDIFKEFIVAGNVPWYLSYDDLLLLFTKAYKYAGSKIASNPISLEFIIAVIGRTKSDLSKQFRYEYNKPSDYNKLKFVGLSDQYNGFDNTVSLLVGSYLKRGTLRSLTKPSEVVTDMEEILTT